MKAQDYLLTRVAFPLAVFSTFLYPATGQVSASAPDLDGDGIPNIIDPDIDNDGLPNAFDPNVDGGIALFGPFKGRYIGDHVNNDNPAETDIDGDGQLDTSLGETDIDGDSLPDADPLEKDIDGDGRDDDSPSELDIDGDGKNDDALDEDDIDGDGFDDNDDINEDDIDGDGLSDDIDEDIDGDNRLNSGDIDDDTDGDGLLNDDPNEDNSDGDSRSDREDDDDDNDGEKDDDDADHHREDDEIEIEVTLDRGPGANSESKAEVEVENYGTGESKLEIKIEGADSGDYELVIDGFVRATLSVNSGELEEEFETYPDDEDERLLDFDIFGLPIEIRKNGVVYFQGTLPELPEAGGPFDGNSINLGTTPSSIVGLSWILDDGSPNDRLDFIDAATGNKIDLGSNPDVDNFSYTYSPTNTTEAELVVTYKVDEWDVFQINFDASTYVVTEYKDGIVDKLDSGILKNG